MRDFLRKNPLRESARSSLGCRPTRGDPQGPAGEGKDVSQNTKTTASARMRAFRGSVKKKIAELEANVTSADTSQKRESSVQEKTPDILVESRDGQLTVTELMQEIPNGDTHKAPLSKNIKVDEENGKDISKTDQKETEVGTESESESVYESRKLIMRRVIRNQAQEAKPATPPDSDHSEVDSWTELEENFAKVYEPIPYSMRMETWQKMTKEEILDNITSERMRAELQQKSRRDILDEISHLRDHPVHFLQKKKNTKGNVGSSIKNCKLSGDESAQKHMIVAEVHSPEIKGFQSDTDSEFGETDYVTRSELYRNIQNLQDSLARHHKQVIEEDSQSWRSLPSQADDPVYISRSEILSKVDRSNSSHMELHKPGEIDIHAKAKDSIYVSRSEILTRLKEIQESEDERGLSPANTIDSSWDLCSCVSCEQCGAGNASASEGECQCHSKEATGKKLEEQDVSHRLPSPGDCSLLSHDSWSNGEFEKIYEPISGPKSVMHHRDFLVNRTLEEQEKRLRKLKFVDENCTSGGRYLPVDQWSLSESEDVYESLARVARASIRRSNTFSNKKSRKRQGGGEVDLQQRVRELLNGQKDINTTTRNKVVKVITDHIEHHLDLDNFEDEEERNQEIRERLKEALAQDWETLSNINLGHIYVPMEDNSKNSKLSSKENADYDTFGSIDSLIFEPKIPVTVEAPSDCVITNEITISASTDCLLDNALGQAASGSDPVLSALNLLNYDMRDKENNQESEQTYEESEEETPVPTPTPSTPRAESEQDLPVYDLEDEHHNVQPEINEIQQLCKAETSSLTQHPWPWVAAGQNARQHTQGKLQSKEENQKLPFKQKFFKGLKELGFIKATSKENLKTSTVYDNTDLGKEEKLNDGVTVTGNSLQMAQMSKLQIELESKQQKDMSGYESFKVNFQRLSGKRLPSEEESTYDYHPDHNEHLYHGDGTTTTSHDTADSETESITSLESVIFKGNIVEETDADMEEKKRKRNPFKHKFVVNHGNESDTSELIENKSLSFSTQPYLDSDTSWDYMEAMDEEKLAMQQYTGEGQSERNSITPGPRVFGNLRRRHVYQSVENIERSVPSQLPEGENSKLQCLDSECVPTVEGIGDCSPSPSSAAVCQGLNLSQLDSSPSTDEESDGRRLFRAYQRRQFRTPSDPSRRDAGGSTSTASHEYEETGEAVYQICGGSFSGSSQGHGTPPVVLLKHHVYQSIESLASRSGLSTAASIKTPLTDDALEELQFYGSRHGEPIYGARNSRLFHSMNGAFVARDNTDGSRDPPVVIRKGKVVELTEEMFKGTLEKMLHSSVNEKTEADLSFHSTLIPSALQGDDCLYFENTVSSTESREVHTYENDSEIYGTHKEIREELLQVSNDAVGDVKNELVPPHDAVMLLENKEGQEAAGGITHESTEKIKKVQKLGVSILGNNNDLMIRELKLKLRRRFNTGDDDEEEVDGKSPTLMKSPLKATVSVDTTSSVAFKREQLAPHMNKIFGSLHEKRRQTMENGVSRNDVMQSETCKIIAESPESRNESKEEKQEKNEKEKCKEREVIRVGGNDGVIEQVYVPTPDYTPASTLPRDYREDNYLSGFTDEEDFSFDLADLAKFVHEHITKNKTLYSDPGNDLLPDGSRIEDTAAVDEEGDSGSPKRSVRFDMSKNLADLTATWSDLESVIFADENSALMETTENGKQENASLLSAGKLPLSRMESYKDDWLLWEQLAKMRRSKVPEDRERWEVEKTKRMLLWIHLSNNNYTQWCYRSQWWKAKQRASVAWIVQKAHKNKVPSDLQDPYYRDYEGAEHLKPGIVHRLANADLYCSALANIYGDPNFHNLSHWNIIQALARKGVYVAEPTDVALTETVLIQVSPIKMSAHLAVIEAMMALYIREVVVAERAVSVLQRVGGGEQPERTPQDQEEALVLWINHIAQALQERVHQQVQSQDQELPVFPRIQDLSDLSDGIGLAALLAFYCPQELPWGEIAVADPPSIADSLYNIGLVIRFCQESLPYNPCLLTKEDIVYMHSSVKQNVLAFVAELFFLLELEPVSCVSLPGTRKTSSKFIQLSSPGRGGVKSPSSGESGSGSGSGTGTGVRRQQSLTERDRPRKERISIHEAQTCQPTREELVPAGRSTRGMGYPQGLSYNLPVRDATHYHHPPSHGHTHERVRARASHPAQPKAYAMKPAGAPSVRRSHSMNLNDMADMRSRMELRSERSEHAPSSYNSDYGGRDSSMSDGQEGDFVVQRSRGLATLSDMMRTQQSPRASQDFEPHYSSRCAAKERYNMDSKEEELGERSRGLVRRGSFTNSQPDLPAAGMPSRYEERPHGRSRSRRNSVSAEDSQLTIENFGGSQDNLNYISRNPDKEPFVHTGRRENTTWEGSQARESREGSARPESRGSRERSVERRREFDRSSIDELDNRLIDKLEREALEREKHDSSQYTSKEKLMARDPRKSAVEAMDSGSESDLSFDREKMSKATSFAELSKLKEQLPGGINIIYMQSDKEDTTKRSNKGPEKKTTFAALPNQTTWKQQSAQSHADDNKSVGDENMEPQIMASELHNVRLKLEEKRRRIESEKRKMEQAMNKQRQKLGKEAFMQAVVKGGKGSSTGSSTPTTSEPEALDVMVDSVEQSLPKPSLTSTATRPNTDLSLKDIGSDVNNLSRRWLEGEGQADELRTPDIDNMDYDEYHKSLTHGESDLEGSRRSSMDHPSAVQLRRLSTLPRDPRDSRVDLRRMSLYLEPGTWRLPSDRAALPPTHPRRFSMGPDSYTQPYRMTDSLTEIQGDIQRLANQQQQIQSMMHNGMTPQTNQGMQQPPPHGQFYLHDQQGSPVRRMWGQQSSSDGYSSMSPATRRAQWGPVRPMMPQGDYMMSGQHPGYYQGYQMNHPAQMPPLSQVNTQQQIGGTGPGFMLHGQTQSHSLPPQAMYQNGQGYYSPEHQYRGYPPSAQTYASGDQRQMGQTPPFRLHGEGIGGEMRGPGSDGRGPGSLRSSAQSSPSRQPLQRQQKSPSPTRQTSVSHAPVAAPPPDDMEPQNVSFIESEDHPQEDPIERFKRLSITSGSKTYRISHEPGSPTRPSLGVKTFRVPTKKGTPVYDDVDLPQPTPPQRSITPPYQDTYRHGEEEEELYSIKTEPLDEPKPEKGFYISFDSDSAPRKPKPQLRTKKMSRKNSSPSTPASTPSREELPVVPDRPSRTSNGSFGSMSQSPSMAPKSPSPSSYPATSTIGSLSPQTNGLFHNSPLGTEQENLHESHTQLPLEDMNTYGSKKQLKESTAGMALVIEDDIANNESSSVSEMEKKKERLMMLSMKRKQEQEEARRRKEMEAQERKDAEKLKEEEKQRKKEEEKARREVILERYKIKKAMEEAEKEGRYYEPPPGFNLDPPSSAPGKQSVRMRNKPAGSKPRPKTMAHAPSASDSADRVLSPSQGKRGSTHNIAGEVGRRGESSGHGSMRKSSGRWGSSHSLSRAAGSRGSSNSLAGDYPSTTRTLERGHTGRRPTSVIGYSSIARGGESRKDSLYGSQGNGLNYHEGYHVHEARRPSLALEGSRMRRGSASSSYGGPSSGYRKYRSTGNLSGQSEHDSLVYHMSEDSGLGRATPPRRAPSPGMARHLPSPSGPGSLPPGLFSKRKQAGFDDAASDISSTASSTADYLGPRLFKQPTAKSNRTIILNAVEYCVFPGAVNQTAKHRVLEEIARSESKHFLVLFRDAGCQFRAIYSFNPETEEVYKLYGTGPKQVTDRMFDKFFKYNSGGKCFSQIHTKHLTVTIDAFTIHNSLWQGKRVNLPSKKDMTLVI
ncbi:uncharacterized protein LOC125034532 isoform X4 [Penaeus chinensis]|uniref:uncharacterized protein LOC125034532 isoform X4 n=1 Tax=Penaeus chinensis TaxID=139456 RepID=UPI001FB65AE5|nr:uncharacterized protein LOC125034532 isoform X4 [Penaeus chinensis]